MMKNIYFACSIRGGRSDALLYKTLVDYLKTEAHVLTELFADTTLTNAGMTKTDADIHTTDIAWINEADAIIAEVTNPSLGVGYEIGYAESLGKPVLALYRPAADRKLSAMIAGSPKTQTLHYQNITDAKPGIKTFLASL